MAIPVEISVGNASLGFDNPMPTNDGWMTHALSQIKSSYGDTCIIKPKSLLKFGSTSNADNGVPTTVMTLPGATQYTETYISTNGITHVSSSSAADTQTMTVEGHTISGSDFTFVVQSVTLSGQTKVALTTPLARITRMANTGATDLAGAIYGYEDDTVVAGVPQTVEKVHIMIPAGTNQSRKAATAFSSVDYGLLTSFYAAVSRSNTANVDFGLQVRSPGGVFRTAFEISVRSTAGPTFSVDFRPFIVVPKNSDVRVQATSSANDTICIAGFNSLLALVT